MLYYVPIKYPKKVFSIIVVTSSRVCYYPKALHLQIRKSNSTFFVFEDFITLDMRMTSRYLNAELYFVMQIALKQRLQILVQKSLLTNRNFDSKLVDAPGNFLQKIVLF